MSISATREVPNGAGSISHRVSSKARVRAGVREALEAHTLTEVRIHTLLTEVRIQRDTVLQVVCRGQKLTDTFSRVVFREFVLVSTFLENLYTI